MDHHIVDHRWAFAAIFGGLAVPGSIMAWVIGRTWAAWLTGLAMVLAAVVLREWAQAHGKRGPAQIVDLTARSSDDAEHGRLATARLLASTVAAAHDASGRMERATGGLALSADGAVPFDWGDGR